MRDVLIRAFLSHPHSVDESYFEHARVALTFAGRLFVAGAAALIHAFIPCLFETTASRAVRDLHAEMVRRASPHHEPAGSRLDRQD